MLYEVEIIYINGELETFDNVKSVNLEDGFLKLTIAAYGHTSAKVIAINNSFVRSYICKN